MVDHETIEDAWKAFYQGVLKDEGDTPDVIGSHKAAFYAGTWELFLRFQRVAATNNPEAVCELLRDTIAEFEEYRQHVTRGERP